VDLNHGDLAGTLPFELGLLTDIAVLHLNSNRFAGGLPDSLPKLSLLYELDVSNNRLSGGFPQHILCLPNVKFVDIRFNNLCGPVPPAIFDKKIDVLFINNNHFDIELPDNFGNSTASVIVLANTALAGCLPPSIGDMADTLVELVLLNTSISSCIPPEIGKLKKLKVLDLSHNEFAGELPDSIGDMESLEVINVGYNMLSGAVPESICLLPNLKNLTLVGNYFCDEPVSCLHIPRRDDRMNCIPDWPHQRSHEQCVAFDHRPPVHCAADGCILPPPKRL
jgi:Leucine-rich repeat (LRR) protein